MSAIKFIQGVARKSLTKNQGSGITTIPGAMQSEAKAAEIVALLQKAGIPTKRSFMATRIGWNVENTMIDLLTA